MKKRLRDFKVNGWMIAAVVTLLIVIAYANILNAPFVMDDVWAIRDNPDVGDPGNIFQHPLSFLRAIMIYVPYQIGGLNPFYFHLLNIFFHIGTTISLFLVIRELWNERYAAITSILFAVHPILIESVTWISSLPTPQYSFFLLLSLYFYIKNNKTKSMRWYYTSLAVFTVSLFSAEKAVVMPGILIILELAFFSLKKHWKKIIPFILLAGVYGGLSLLHIGPRIQDFQTNYNADVKFTNPMVNIPYSIINYLRLIVFPDVLTVYHADRAISFFEYGIYLVLFLLFVAGVVFAYRRSKTVFFWLTFFFITLTPTYLPIMVVWTVAERYVYLGTAGVIAAFAYALYKVSENKKYAAYIYIAVAFITLLLLFRTITRNNDFKTEEDLWVATVEASPESPNAHNNMGYVYSLWGDERSAVQEYAMAIQLKPNYADAYHNMGLSYLRMNNWEMAVKSFSAAVEYNPKLWQSHVNLAGIYLATGKLDMAEQHAVIAQKIMPTNERLQAILQEIRNKK